MVDDSYQWFADLVAERRKLSKEDTAKLADGRVYTGRQALANTLIDAIGGELKAVEWLEKQPGVAEKLSIIDWARETQGRSIAGRAENHPPACRRIGLGAIVPGCYKVDRGRATGT